MARGGLNNKHRPNNLTDSHPHVYVTGFSSLIDRITFASRTHRERSTAWELNFAMSRLRCAVAALILGASRAAEVALIRTMWGVERFDHVEQWPALFQDLAKSNYSGVEAPTWVVCGVGPTFSRWHECDESRSTAFRAALQASGLLYIAQVHTCGYPIASASPRDHLGSLHALLVFAKGELGADFANVHGGVDFWSPAEMLEFFRGAKTLQEWERRLIPATISHETHRMRALSTPMAASLVLDAVPGVRLTADLSHWVVGAERLFDFPSDAGWWPKLLQKVADATVLTHARVGAPREIQVADPAAPEHRELLATYEAWWAQIWAAQAAREGVVYVEAEFGPTPYMPALPHTLQPLASLHNAVEFVGQRQRRRLMEGVCRAVP